MYQGKASLLEILRKNMIWGTKCVFCGKKYQRPGTVGHEITITYEQAEDSHSPGLHSARDVDNRHKLLPALKMQDISLSG